MYRISTMEGLADALARTVVVHELMLAMRPASR